MAPPRWKVVAAFAAIYLVWGATFLGMRFALQQVPPLLLVSIRCLSGAAILFAWARASGVEAGRADWTGAALTGSLFFVTGQGMLAYGQQFVPSGLAAVMLASIPLWIVVVGSAFDRAWPGWVTMAGVATGFGGVLMLAASRLPGGLRGFHPAAGAALLGSAFSWALGTHLSRRRATTENPLRRTARQLLVGGAAAFGLTFAAGQAHLTGPAPLSGRTVGAVAYLIVGGTVMGFGAYSWLLRVAAPAVVGTYAFVNPVVALALGWLVADEPLTGAVLVASAVILSGVALVVLAPRVRVRAGVDAARPPG